MDTEDDQAFLQILRDKKNIVNFLDAFFGFLYRCTDFYVESTPDAKLGFPPGVQEKLVLGSLQKWKNISKLPREALRSTETKVESGEPRKEDLKSTEVPEATDVPRVAEEVEIPTVQEQKTSCRNDRTKVEEYPPSNGYNGAIRDDYTWSQTISDLDVFIKLPSCLKRSKDLKVHVDARNIDVKGRTSTMEGNGEAKASDSEWTSVFRGELCFDTKKGQTVWSLAPGRYLNISLEKASERWWEALIVGEPKIDLSKIDCSRDWDDMGSAEQMKMQELVWNHRQKVLGKPTSEQIKMEKILKKAWDAKGSPFEGTPYDPSVLKFN